MDRNLTVYRHIAPLAEYDDAQPLNLFPSVTITAEDDEPLRMLINRALVELAAAEDINTERATSLGYFLAFARAAHDPSLPAQWRFQMQYYGVNQEGLLFVDDEQLRRMTVGDLRRSSENGYLLGAWDQIVVMEPEGLGGPGELVSPFLDFLESVGVDIVAGAVLAGSVKIAATVGREVCDRRARQVIDSWHEHGINGPWVIRRWIDQKRSWPASEVATRLSINQAEAESLLKALGYDYSDRLIEWTVGTTKKAKKRRERWEDAESIEWQRPR